MSSSKLVLVMTVFLCAITYAGESLDVSLNTAAWRGSCDSIGFKIVANSNVCLTIYNDADGSKQPLKSGWPEGYTVEAAIDYQRGADFIPNIPIDQLNPVPYKSMVNYNYELGMLSDPRSYIDTKQLNSKSFSLRVPRDLVGHTLTFRARYNDHGYSLLSSLTQPLQVIAPCDEYDQARIIASWIYVATQSLNYERAFQLADSMLENGLTDLEGWYWARVAAQGAGRAQKYMNYLERMWEDFGRMDTSYDSGDPPPRYNNNPRDPDMQGYYEQTMDNLREIIAEREQQDD